MLRRLRSLLRRIAAGALAPARFVGRGLRSAGHWLARGVFLRRDRLGIVVHLALLAIGIGVGLLLALPVGDVTDRCPARGEGYDFCWVQKALLPSILVVLAGGLLSQWIASLALVRWPLYMDRVRQVGERRMGEEESREPPPYARDPFLLASTWGTKAGRTDRRRPRFAELIASFQRRPRLTALLARLRRR